MWQRKMARALPVIAGARPPPLKREAFFGRTPVKGAPQGGELAELARPEGLTLRELPLHCFAYFSISCSQNSAVLSQLYFFRTSSGAATG